MDESESWFMRLMTLWKSDHPTIRSLGAPTIHVLLSLASYSDDKGGCYPSQESLAVRAHMGTRQLREHLKTLRDRNIITVRQRGLQRTAVYQILSPEEFRHASPEEKRRSSPEVYGSQPGGLRSSARRKTAYRTSINLQEPPKDNIPVSVTGRKTATAVTSDMLSPRTDSPPSQKRQPSTPKPRPRNLLYDALADLTKCAGGQIAKYLKELKDADSQVTPEKIAGFAQWWPVHCGDVYHGQLPSPAKVALLWPRYLQWIVAGRKSARQLQAARDDEDDGMLHL